MSVEAATCVGILVLLTAPLIGSPAAGIAGGLLIGWALGRIER